MDILGTEASWGKYISIFKSHRTLQKEGDKNCVFKDELVSDNKERAPQIESNKYTKQKAINTQSNLMSWSLMKDYSMPQGLQKVPCDEKHSARLDQTLSGPGCYKKGFGLPKFFLKLLLKVSVNCNIYK